MATTTTFYTSTGTNYINGSSGGYSDIVGWDSRRVRSEVFTFTTGSEPISHIHFTGPHNTVYDGNDIPIMVGISSSLSTFVTEYGHPQGSQEYDADDPNDIDINLSPNTPYYMVFFPGTYIDEGSWYGLLNFDDSSIEITATLAYTKCTAPTSVSINKDIEVPGQTARLSWSGATAGTNLSIASYLVYYSTSPSILSEQTYLGSTQNSYYDVTAPARNTTYYYRIVARSSLWSDRSYDSGYSNVYASLKGNSLPDAPTINSVNPATIPSTATPSNPTEVEFRVTAGADPDGKPVSLYYSTNSGQTKTSFSSPLRLGLAGETTISFYSYDGLEYSSATSRTVEVNDAPLITSISAAVNTYNALGGSGLDPYQAGYANSIDPAIDTNKTGSVEVGIEYYFSNGVERWAGSQGTGYGYVTLQQRIPISSTYAASLGHFDVQQYIPWQSVIGSTNIHWRFYCRLYDATEASDWIYYPEDSSGMYFSIARSSPVLDIYNQFSTSNIIGTNSGEVWCNVRLKVYNDTSVPYVAAAATVGTTGITPTVTTSVAGPNNEYRYIDITLPDGIPSGATVNIMAETRDSGPSIAKPINATVTETKLPTLGTLSHGAQAIKPFTSDGAFEIYSTWPFGLYEHIDDTTLAAYNCSKTASDVIKLVYSSSNTGGGANRVEKTLTWDRSGDNIATTMDREDAYDWDHSLGISVYAGTITYYCRLEITNLFGKVVSTPWLAREFNFAEPVQSPTITSIDWSLDETNWTPLGNNAIQEGVYLRFNCSFSLFTTDEIELSVLLTNSSGERSISCYESGSPTRLTPITYLASELSRASNRTAVASTKSYVYHITNEIADTVARQWRLQFKNSGYTTNSSYISTPVIRQCAPDLVLVECETDENYKLMYTYDMTDKGFDTTNVNNSLTNYLSDGSARVATGAIANTIGEGVEGEIQAAVTGWDAKPMCVEMVSVVTGLYTNTKTYYSNLLLVFAISPTVAYRKNRLGVNTDNPASNTIVDIHQSTKRKTILIQGYTDNIEPSKFEIDVSTGQIKFYVNNTLQHTLDLMNGTLT